MNTARKYVMMPFDMAHERHQVKKAEEVVDSSPLNENIDVPDITQVETLQQNGSQKIQKTKNYIKERARLRLENILKIITKVALINGYDSERRIRSRNGKYISNTDIVDLVIYSMQPGKIINGEREFISLLREANVDPNWLFNENVKSKLYQNNNNDRLQENNISNIKQPSIDNVMYAVRSPIVKKRKFAEESDSEPRPTQSKKRKLDVWEYTDDEQ